MVDVPVILAANQGAWTPGAGPGEPYVLVWGGQFTLIFDEQHFFYIFIDFLVEILFYANLIVENRSATLLN